MEKLSNFQDNVLNNTKMRNLKGGSNGQGALMARELRSLMEPEVHATGAFLDDDYTPEDYWTDVDGNGQWSTGDKLCFN